ncbi:BJ4_G0020010.mRNA.1.CDS.1 [Saccharomyces cerevisiae]|nr:BJ4_G0020010.mRNA.1.CDS.1 [Saccharomyces cerevisiae]
MALIVASLFLPYQPQFELDTSLPENSQVDSSLVNIQAMANDQQQQRALSNNISQESLVAPAPEQGVPPAISRSATRSPSAFNRASSTTNTATLDDLVSSDIFMENLTANATTSHTPTSKTMLKPRKNGSVERFFSPSSNIPTDRIASPIQHEHDSGSRIASPIQQQQQDPTANLLKNVNKSLLVHSLLNNTSQTSLEGPNNHIVTPKSRAGNRPTSAATSLVNRTKKGSASSGSSGSSAPPSIKRITPHLTASAAKQRPLLAKQPSNLKYSELADISSSETSSQHNESDPDDLTTAPDEEYVSDLEMDDAKQDYKVPKFGGYSNKSKLKKYALLRSSQELFSRLPWSIVPSIKGNGAMKNAINTAVLENIIPHRHVKWVGTVGIPTDEIPENILANISDSLKDKYDSYPVLTDDVTFKAAYKNYCKQILWPTLHYQIPDNPNSKAFEDHSWKFYRNLNQRFADAIVKIYKKGDTIWIHDYHLMLVPQMVRDVLPFAKIGFTLHVSFPSSEVFRCLAQREKILEGLTGADFVGFQTREYARHFLQTSNRLLMADVVHDEELKYNGRVVSVRFTPVGIDAFDLQSQLKDGSVMQWRQLIRERWQGKKLIVCRDQFDRIRGIHKKLLAYEKFLVENPEYVEKSTLIQICIGSSKDVELERQIMIVVDRINSLSTNISISQPVVFLHQDLDFSQYLALSSEADLFVVSSLREGMNLTCHEFIVCSEDKNAPLLLSEFTGSASLLNDGAIIINPWDTKNFSQAILKGLEMPFDKRRPQWKKLMKDIINNDSTNWIKTSLQDIHISWQFNQEGSKIFKLNTKTLMEDYLSSKKRMFVFNIAEPPSSRMISILNDMTSKGNIVYIMNSFPKPILENLYSRVQNIGLIAENGAYVSLNGVWYNIVDQVDWRNDVAKILEDKVERLPGSYYKINESMIKFHTENAEDQDRVASVIGDAITHINTVFDHRGIHAYVYKNVVSVQQVGLSLSAAQFLFRFYNSASDPLDTSSGQITNIQTPSQQNPSDQEQQPPASPTVSMNHIDFACVSGSSSPVLEPLFKLVNDEASEGQVKAGHAIVYGDSTSTYAKEHVNGLNELFTIISRIIED